MTSTRPYRMDARAAAAAATRDRIASAAEQAFTTQWYDDVTIRGVAADAGVSQQTVLNHFPTKEDLCEGALLRFVEGIQSRRFQVVPGDIDAAAAVLVDDYEVTGDATMRMLAIEERVPTIRPWLSQGREEHERWVAMTFSAALRDRVGTARAHRLAQLVVATDVYAWKLLRRDRGMPPDEVTAAIADHLRLLHTP